MMFVQGTDNLGERLGEGDVWARCCFLPWTSVMRWPCIEGHAKTRRTLSISFPRQFLFLSSVAAKSLTVNRMKLGCKVDLRRADESLKWCFRRAVVRL